MKVSKIKEILRQLLKANVVPMLWGPPGIGKSAVVKQVAEEEGLSLIDLRLSLLDSVDLRGLPRYEDGSVEWARPEFIPDSGKGILFLDEITTALPAVQNAALQLIYDRRCGPHRLGNDWHIVCAGNSREDLAHVFQLSSALTNRMVHINCEVDVEDVIEYGIKEGWAEEVIGFLKWRPGLVYTKPLSNKPFATPRAYEFLSRVIKVSGRVDGEIVSGIIGQEAGVEFATYIKVYKDLPDIDAVLNGKPFKFPSEASAQIAFLSALALRISENNLDLIFQILEKVNPELNVWVVKILFQRKLKVTENRQFKEWSKKYKELVL